MKTITLTVPSVGTIRVNGSDSQLSQLLNDLCDIVPGRVIHYRVIA